MTPCHTCGTPTWGSQCSSCVIRQNEAARQQAEQTRELGAQRRVAVTAAVQAAEQREEQTNIARQSAENARIAGKLAVEQQEKQTEYLRQSAENAWIARKIEQERLDIDKRVLLKTHPDIFQERYPKEWMLHLKAIDYSGKWKVAEYNGQWKQENYEEWCRDNPALAKIEELSSLRNRLIALITQQQRHNKRIDDACANKRRQEQKSLAKQEANRKAAEQQKREIDLRKRRQEQKSLADQEANRKAAEKKKRDIDLNLKALALWNRRVISVIVGVTALCGLLPALIIAIDCIQKSNGLSPSNQSKSENLSKAIVSGIVGTCFLVAMCFAFGIFAKTYKTHTPVTPLKRPSQWNFSKPGKIVSRPPPLPKP